MKPEPIDLFIINPGNPESITCKLCGSTSYNQNDVQNRYCGRCHLFLGDIWPLGRQWMLDRAKRGKPVH